MRGLIYCAHLSGVGHLKRMLTLAEGLVKECDITLIQAGRNERITFLHPNFRHIGIPLLSSEVEMISRGDFTNLENTMKIRRKKIFSLLDFNQHYDFIITEQMPFSKSAFLYEALSIVESMKIVNPAIALISSQKGGTVFNPEEQKSEVFAQIQAEVAKHLRWHYDKVLVHCDPQITTLDEMFIHCDEIRDMIEYTGYIYPRSEKYSPSEGRGKTILVTTGSGSKGFLLILEVLKLISKMPDYRFFIVTTAMMPSNFRALLKKEEENLPNLEVVDFLDNFDKKLRECSLAITLGGSTLINLYATGTPALVFPEPFDSGQELLAEKFAQHGIVNLIRKEQLDLDALHHLVVETIENPPKPDIELNIAGVENSLNAIRKIVKEKRARR